MRDRATFYVRILKEKQKALNSAYILNGKWHQGQQGGGAWVWGSGLLGSVWGIMDVMGSYIIKQKSLNSAYCSMLLISLCRVVVKSLAL